MAILGAAFGALALFYLVFARALTLKDLELSIAAQLIAKRIITPLLFVVLGALAVSCEYFRRDRIHAGTKKRIFVGVLCFVVVVALPVAIVVCILNTPFWSSQVPAVWNRPQFSYGWFLPLKGERSMAWTHMICPFLNLFLWTLYLMVLVGYKRIRQA